MDTQPSNDVPDLSVLMNTAPESYSNTHKSTATSSNKSKILFGSAIMLFMFTLFSTGIILYQTQQKESVTQTDTQAAFGDLANETSATIPQDCDLIILYKNNVKVTPADLKPGDSVTIAVPKGQATKARFKINGGQFEVTKEKENREFVMDYTFPADTTNVVIRAERFIDDVWQ